MLRMLVGDQSRCQSVFSGMLQTVIWEVWELAEGLARAMAMPIRALLARAMAIENLARNWQLNRVELGPLLLTEALLVVACEGLRLRYSCPCTPCGGLGKRESQSPPPPPLQIPS